MSVCSRQFANIVPIWQQKTRFLSFVYKSDAHSVSVKLRWADGYSACCKLGLFGYNMGMSGLRLYAVTDNGAEALQVPPHAADFVDLYTDLALGTYSALRTFEHDKFLDLAGHIARTKLSMELLGIAYCWDERRLRQALHQVVSGYPAADARVRFDVLAEPAYSLGTNSRELIALKPFVPVPASFYEEGIGADFAPLLQREMARAKTARFCPAAQPPGAGPGAGSL